MSRIRWTQPLALPLVGLALALGWIDFQSDTPRIQHVIRCGPPLPGGLGTDAEPLRLREPTVERLSPVGSSATRARRNALKARPGIERSTLPALPALAAGQPASPSIDAPQPGIGVRHQFSVRGQVYLNLPPNTGPIYLHVSATNAEPQSEFISLAGGPIMPSGEFDSEAWAPSAVEILRLAFSDERGTFHVRDIPAEHLSTPLFVSLDSEIEEFKLEVYDHNRMPIQAARLRILAQNVGPDDTWNAALTDESGSATFLLPSGPIEYCIAKTGFRFMRGLVDFDARGDRMPLKLTLLRLGIQDQISGQALDEHGAPVSNALITAGPYSEPSEPTISANVSTRSNHEGHFSLMIAGNAPVILSAFRRDLGQTPLMTLGDGEHQVTLTFPPLDDPDPKGPSKRPRESS